MTVFSQRHIGPTTAQQAEMLQFLGYADMPSFIEAVVPADIREDTLQNLPSALSEEQALAAIQQIANRNTVKHNLIGQGYYGTYTPQVILRNVLLNPGWYTAYTPYQPEISQGRLEVLFHFQTLVCELTGLDVANASLLDEATAAAEAMLLCYRQTRGKRPRFLLSVHCHPQTIDVVRTRAVPLDIAVELVDEDQGLALDDQVCGVLLQYPRTLGGVVDYRDLAAQIHAVKALLVVAADPLALCILQSPGMMGADIAIGSMQRFGVPMFGGGPHAGYFAVKDALKRNMPGRLVGESVDAAGNPAYRLALQTREQHIRREKATSNICTAQALLAMTSTLYACYHGPEGLCRMANKAAAIARFLSSAFAAHGWQAEPGLVFELTTLS